MMTTDIRLMLLLMIILGQEGISVRLTNRLALVPVVTGHITLASTPAGVGRLIDGGAGVDIGDLAYYSD